MKSAMIMNNAEAVVQSLCDEQPQDTLVSPRERDFDEDFP